MYIEYVQLEIMHTNKSLHNTTLNSRFFLVSSHKVKFMKESRYLSSYTVSSMEVVCSVKSLKWYILHNFVHEWTVPSTGHFILIFWKSVCDKKYCLNGTCQLTGRRVQWFPVFTGKNWQSIFILLNPWKCCILFSHKTKSNDCNMNRTTISTSINILTL
jgi:hypothetical protein